MWITLFVLEPLGVLASIGGALNRAKAQVALLFSHFGAKHPD
jgi:hypothetical protein